MIFVEAIKAITFLAKKFQGYNEILTQDLPDTDAFLYQLSYEAFIIG